jgi:hypothetical protein
MMWYNFDMHRDYEHRLEESNTGGKTFTFRLSPSVRAELQGILNVEGGDLSQLVIEGVWRVIEDRRSDARYQELSRQAITLQHQLDEVRAQLHEKAE